MQKSNNESHNFYITTTLPYVNADPHIGFAAEIIRADVLARWHRLLGDEVFFNTGTDEHGLKIFKKAEENGVSAQEVCDMYSAKFKELTAKLNLSVDNFIRTTDEHHVSAAQEFWKICDRNGFIYKKNYSVKYCIGCELEKTESELVNGECPYHPGKPLELIEEENYFFRFSAFQEKLLEFYKNNPNFVVPANRFNEIRNFVSGGLEDFSISRLKAKLPWGVPVPGDEDQVMYVWFDALVNYISALGWIGDRTEERENDTSPNPLLEQERAIKDGEVFKKFWPGLQVCGKDNLRQQTAMWQAMLMAAGLPNSKQVLVFGFITSNGQKMSKSLGNVVNPLELIEKYGIDATRYYLLAELPPFEDGDFSFEKFEIRYNADLANGLGNLVARVSNLLEKFGITNSHKSAFAPLIRGVGGFGGSSMNKKCTNSHKFYVSDCVLFKEVCDKLNEYRFDEALKVIWAKLKECDEVLTAKAPWKMTDKGEVEGVLKPIAQTILDAGYLLLPFMPETAEKIIKQFSEMQVKKGEGLFPRLVNKS